MPELYVGRQPIFDRKRRTHAYELLFRSGDKGGVQMVDGDMATARVLVNTLSEIGLDKVVGRHPAFINVTEQFILANGLSGLLPKQCVLEILETVAPTEQVIESVQALSKDGYAIALDDFEYSEAFDPLLEIADIVKLDVMQLGMDGVRQQLETLRRFDVKLLAEKVETAAEFDACLDMGFDYFQGFFFAKPQVLKAKAIPANKLAVLELISKVNDPEIGLQDLGEIIARDAALSVKTLRYVNSPAVGLASEVSSINQALTLLGMEVIRQWVMILALSGVDMEEKSPELFILMLTRARFCQSVAEMAGLENPGSYFTIGLLSAIDVLMDAPKAELIEPLPLTPEVKSALLTMQGQGGQVLLTALAMEQGRLNVIPLRQLGMESLNSAYIDALAWADELNRGV